jgi:hypothetical protein
MYVYIRSEPGLWTVGFYSPDGKWNPESDFNSMREAARRVSYLNGGSPLAETRGENFLANARLIAAAPGLLEACKNALELIVNIQSREEGPMSMPWIEEQELEAAIARAEGKE